MDCRTSPTVCSNEKLVGQPYPLWQELVAAKRRTNAIRRAIGLAKNFFMVAFIFADYERFEKRPNNVDA